MQQLLQQHMQRPAWMEKAESLSILGQIRHEEAFAREFDENYHEYEDNIDERTLCNSFTVQDPSQCIDKHQATLDWEKFTEEQENTCAHTILGDLPEDIPTKRALKTARADSPYTRMGNLTLHHLALNGDKRAAHVLSLRNGALARSAGVEIIFEYGEMQQNGNLKTHTGWAGTEEAAYYRAALKSAAQEET